MPILYNEKTGIEQNIFKFEKKIHSRMNKYLENGAMLVTYLAIDQNSSTVDRGLQNIEALFGENAPLRYNIIYDFPLYGFGQTNSENTSDNNMEDFMEQGQCTIIPSTIMPRENDFFIINHIHQDHLFKITGVEYDGMKEDGFYRISYVLQTTSKETINMLMQHVVGKYHTELSAIGANDMNPIIKEDNWSYRNKILQMIYQMMLSYRGLFYNERHNCFLYHDPESGLDWFDTCGNEFIAKHGLMNPPNSMNVVVLHDKLQDPQFSLYYNNSVYKWLELDAPNRFLQKFYFKLKQATFYPYSSFCAWNDKNTQIIIPMAKNETSIRNKDYSIFDDEQFNSFLNPNIRPNASEFDLLIWKFINQSKLLLEDISLYLSDTLLNNENCFDTFFYTPIVIFIIKKILRMN